MAKFTVEYKLFKKMPEGTDERVVVLSVDDPGRLSNVLGHNDLLSFVVTRNPEKSKSRSKKSIPVLSPPRPIEEISKLVRE